MKSQTLGSSLLIAGTSIGAGMLALPLVAALTGLGWGVFLMLLMWGLSTYGGLLIAEACRACPEADNLHGVMGRLMGPIGQGIAVVAMLFLYYSLCAAYISGGATVLGRLLEKEGVHLPFRITATVVVLLVAILVVTGTRVVDVVNRGMFALMLALLLYIVLSLLPEVSLNNVALENRAPGILLAALPVMYTSFGYHCAVPTVVQYVQGKPHRFRYALIGGSLLPFSIYVIWMIVVIGVVSSSTVIGMAHSPDGVTLLMDAIASHSKTASFDYMISAFAAFALGTSFLGVALGLFDYLAEVFGRSHGIWGRIETITLTLLIPLLVAIFMPGSFVTALGYAAVALVILAVFIPVALVWKVRKLHMEEPYQVAGGIPALAVAAIIGLLVIVAQFGVISGLLPSIG
ncbi:aromatic amino acid transport family protein [Endozoicomonas sp.]|uniref:aromatic amino acid transport family protein n=1 Tax=Endozoicomonas sp. TaxID=1892382 RepID=UPI002887C204|nr:aromatic amino acid transport family protein [Endozoicomonas sp.]